jgi:hypothetical protein
MTLLDDATPPTPGPAHRAPLVAAALVAVGLGIGAMLWLGRPPRPAATRPSTSTIAPSVPPGSRPSAAAGRLEVTADQPGARVSVDGQPVGVAPQSVADLSAGRHAVRVDLPGFEPWSQEAHLLPGLTTRLHVRLLRAPASLRIECDVAGASVFFDRRFVGAAPVELHDVTPGTHQVNVSADGFEMRAETVDVTAGPATVAMRLREVRLDEALDVIHRHNLGSCTGRLSATPAGVRYETPNPKDGFEAPLATIERLEVDYLKRTLLLRLRGGRTYTFTTRGASADPLLVFQQNVDKARAVMRRSADH